jgi:hypothetical protein
VGVEVEGSQCLQIGVPALRADRFTETSACLRFLQIRPDDRRAWKARDMRDLRMDLDFAVVFA